MVNWEDFAQNKPVEESPGLAQSRQLLADLDKRFATPEETQSQVNQDVLSALPKGKERTSVAPKSERIPLSESERALLDRLYSFVESARAARKLVEEKEEGLRLAEDEAMAQVKKKTEELRLAEAIELKRSQAVTDEIWQSMAKLKESARLGEVEVNLDEPRKPAPVDAEAMDLAIEDGNLTNVLKRIARESKEAKSKGEAA